MIYLRGTYAAV